MSNVHMDGQTILSVEVALRINIETKELADQAKHQRTNGRTDQNMWTEELVPKSIDL